MNTNIHSWRKGFIAAAVLGTVFLSGCGSSGDADPGGVLSDSITISDLTGSDSGAVGQAFTMEVRVVVTGGVPANQITYKWEQTEGMEALEKQQVDGEYKSNFSFKPVASGTVTIKVTATTASGKVASQAKTVTVNPITPM